MKRIYELMLFIVLGISTLSAQEFPAGIAGPAGAYEHEVRALSHARVATRVPITWTACGVAKIDGILSPGEWSSAATQVITVNTSAGAVPATLYVMSDNLTLYVALKFPESGPNVGSLAIEFDNNNNGVPFEAGDDAIVYNNQIGFFDDFRSPCPLGMCAPEDTTAGGTSEGRGAYRNDGTYSVYEIAHPFDTFDLNHDIALCHGNYPGSATCGTNVGFFIMLRQIDTAGAIHDTYYPDVGVYDQIYFASCAPLALSACGTPNIDGKIMPGEWPISGQYKLSVNTTPNGETATGSLYFMNDSFNLYCALAYDDSSVAANQEFIASFFVNSSTIWQDFLSFKSGSGFTDEFVRNPTTCFTLFCLDTDVNGQGTNDGSGALANDGVQTAFEIAHPLNSGDAHDMAANFGDVMTWYEQLHIGTALTPTGVTSSLIICTPAPMQNVADLTQRVSALGQSGALSPKNVDTLSKDLIKANGNLQTGKMKQAANDLGNFVFDVTKMVRKGDLADANAQPLINAANSAMSQL